jgi:hypothetical protein
MLAQSDPARSKQLMQGAQHAADARWQLYEQMAGVHRIVTEDGRATEGGLAPAGAAAEPAAAGDNKPGTAAAKEAT